MKCLFPLSDFHPEKERVDVSMIISNTKFHKNLSVVCCAVSCELRHRDTIWRCCFFLLLQLLCERAPEMKKKKGW